MGCHIRLFADDTILYINVENPDMAVELLNIDLDKIMKWAKKKMASHYENKHMQHTAIIHGSKYENFHLNFFTFFIFLFKT